MENQSEPQSTVTKSGSSLAEKAGLLQKNMDLILKEHLELCEKIDFTQVARLIPELRSAQRIFTAGAGRSGLSMQAAAMRLMHFGFQVYVSGETTTPAIRPGDLLLIASGSGTTRSMITAAEKAVAAGARVIAISTTAQSPLADLSALTMVIPAAQKQDHGQTLSLQYAGSLFEQGLLLLSDAVFQTLLNLEYSPAETLWKRHANLE